ncbi:hypothetical protein [uncultured Methanomethylovorans sp.]|uniref:hypothetical protein n=1 Tax=uncultured Methanomethylovorans sp. TaxID=183759 RepID=UPI002601F67A|nr:hypothetical protein [uncultured Methanomethylovorans sp.]
MCDDEVDLTPNEIKVLTILGKLHISQHKNVKKESIAKRLPQQYQSSLNDVIKSLHHKGLINYYRKDNYSMTPKGKKIAEELAAKLSKDLYKNLRILLLL